ncbi:UNKNOWN [Stylonychia lemnae]|uniref:Uncharacterized protein n=1 Tax=Stylonychia lemnae TaxID=5949 RepID=A0A078B5A0_STYLE|nr:UNKNOWN [Stylonychia lemnae]|eukprot:CDW88457.1 UNKNOWN [Stylonychia lemnae]
MYGEPFQFTIKGQNEARQLDSQVYIDQQYKLFRYIINQGQKDDPTIIDLYQLGFDVAFGLYEEIDPKYGSIYANHKSYQRIKNESSQQIEEKEYLKIGGAWTTN